MAYLILLLHMIKIIIIIINSTSLGRPWSPLFFRINYFKGWSFKPHAHPQPAEPGYPFSSIVIAFYVFGMGGPTSNIRYFQHSSLDHLTTQATPMRQSRVTFGEILLHRPTKMLTLCAFQHKLYVTDRPGTTTRKLNPVK